MVWQPIETAPKDRFLLLCGPSGYTTTPLVFTTGRMCSDYHAGRWIDHANDDLSDWGFEPTHWAPLPEAPDSQETRKMSPEFEREERYLVFKLSDVVEHLTTTEVLHLERLYEIQRVGRREAGKAELECVVVESDWPEYEPTWKAIEARVTGAQPAPSVPEGWLRAIDEALVTVHIGGANASDTYEQAKAKLDSLIGFHVDVATDPAVNGGWQLAPIVSTDEMDSAGSEHCDGHLSTAQVVWDAMLAAAPNERSESPEAKP